MSEFVVLSDSDDSVLLSENTGDVSNRSLQNLKERSFDSDDVDLPAVQFSYISDLDYLKHSNETQRIRNSYSSDELVCKNPQTDSVIQQQKNESDSSPSRNIEDLKNVDIHKVPAHSMSDSSESEEESNKSNSDKRISQNDICLKVPEKKKKTAKGEKNKVTEEKIKRRKNATHLIHQGKVLKAIAAKSTKNMKPGECIKFMEVIIDENVENANFYEEIIGILKDSDIKYNVCPHLIASSITWKRNIEDYYVDENNQIQTIQNVQNEKQILIIWSSNEVVQKIMNDSFYTSLLSIKTLMKDYTMTLIIFGIENYFNQLKKSKKKSQSTNLQVLKEQFKTCLIEIQIKLNCNNRIVETAKELALVIYQYTKSISEIPYKLEKNKNFEHKFDWYVEGDNKDTVRVDKDGNGLKRLWQQQLRQFNLSSLETAEAICSTYSSPVQLMEAYKNCSSGEGANLLKDIPIRRAAGPLTTMRKIGPELSKKIYTMYTSEDGEVVL